MFCWHRRNSHDLCYFLYCCVLTLQSFHCIPTVYYQRGPDTDIALVRAKRSVVTAAHVPALLASKSRCYIAIQVCEPLRLVLAGLYRTVYTCRDCVCLVSAVSALLASCAFVVPTSRHRYQRAIYRPAPLPNTALLPCRQHRSPWLP